MHRPCGWDRAPVAQDLQMLTSVSSSRNILARLADGRGEACPPGHETDTQVIPFAPEEVLHKHEVISKLATPGHGASRSPGLRIYRGLFSDDLSVCESNHLELHPFLGTVGSVTSGIKRFTSWFNLEQVFLASVTSSVKQG